MNMIVSKTVTTLALSGAIASEILHTMINRTPWAGFTLAANNVSYLLILGWALAIGGLWSRRSGLKFFLVLGIAGLCAHGLVLSAGGNLGLGAFYVGMFVLALVSAVHAQLLESAVRNGGHTWTAH